MSTPQPAPPEPGPVPAGTAPAGGRWNRLMRARDRDEQHRAATPLELFFDLCFVVAVSLAAARLHHDLSEHHVGAGVLGYLLVFFAIWWAWMNFTWFASAFDTDDPLYRLTTLVQITGALVLAAGVPAAFEDGDFRIVVTGYVIMRLAMVAQWLRAGAANPGLRPTTRRYAVGILLVQLGWVARLWAPPSWQLATFVLLAAAELTVPAVAERVGATTWHVGHIAERYGNFTLIVLGEVVLAVTSAIEGALGPGSHGGEAGPEGGHADPVTLLGLAGAGALVVFTLWWLYFDEPAEQLLLAGHNALGWGYGHVAVFASAAAVGAGLEVAVDAASGRAELTAAATGPATAIPVAVFLASLWVLRRGWRPDRSADAPAVPVRRFGYPAAVLAVLAVGWTPAAVPLVALVLVVLALATVVGRDVPAPAVPAA